MLLVVKHKLYHHQQRNIT